MIQHLFHYFIILDMPRAFKNQTTPLFEVKKFFKNWCLTLNFSYSTDTSYNSQGHAIMK